MMTNKEKRNTKGKGRQNMGKGAVLRLDSPSLGLPRPEHTALKATQGSVPRVSSQDLVPQDCLSSQPTQMTSKPSPSPAELRPQSLLQHLFTWCQMHAIRFRHSGPSCKEASPGVTLNLAATCCNSFLSHV